MSQQALGLAGELALPVVATHPIQFLDPDDFRAHEARVCIAEGYVLGDQRRPKHFTGQQYFKTRAEMADLFGDIPEALENSVEIAKRCNLTVELGKSKLPLFPIPDGMDENAYLIERAEDGLAQRMKELYPDEGKRAELFPVYAERLRFETGTIVQMGFPGYFLIVADFINWAKHNGVPVGPGRGSARVRWWLSASASPTSTRCAMPCCSNASSTPNGCPCPTSTSISARKRATK